MRILFFEPLIAYRYSKNFLKKYKIFYSNFWKCYVRYETKESKSEFMKDYIVFKLDFGDFLFSSIEAWKKFINYTISYPNDRVRKKKEGYHTINFLK